PCSLCVPPTARRCPSKAQHPTRQWHRTPIATRPTERQSFLRTLTRTVREHKCRTDAPNTCPRTQTTGTTPPVHPCPPRPTPCPPPDEPASRPPCGLHPTPSLPSCSRTTTAYRCSQTPGHERHDGKSPPPSGRPGCGSASAGSPCRAIPAPKSAETTCPSYCKIPTPRHPKE